jgi:hypothetical protein
MKNKRFLFFGRTLIIGMAFSLALAGCPIDDDGGDEGGPSVEELANPLAADINNRPKSSEGDTGRAEANGSIVTLKGGFIDVRTNLTVPAGVTLDVTTDGHLGLYDMTLTVNGTANVNSNRIRLEDTATYGIIKGNGTIYLKGKGRLLEVGGNKNVADRKLTLDGVTLAGVADNDSSLVVVRGGGEGWSGEFIMKSGEITGNTRVSGSDEWSSGGGVQVSEGGTFTMEGGTISGNTVEGEWTRGGGVDVESGGTFTMQGGVISGNTAQGGEEGNGGGVLVRGKSVFTMTGGKISGNRAGTGGEKLGLGGGVKVQNGGMFTMEGGEISGNTAQSGEHAEGGGVRVSDDGSEFTLKGGTISGNSAAGENYGVGGGVMVYNGATFTMGGGAISGNTASGKEGSDGGGVRVVGETATFTMEGGTISGNRAKVGGGVEVGTSGTFTLEGGTIYGKTDKLPGGADAKLANIAEGGNSAALNKHKSTAKWGTGGEYTKGGETQTGGNDIVTSDGDSAATDETLIAVPAP